MTDQEIEKEIDEALISIKNNENYETVRAEVSVMVYRLHALAGDLAVRVWNLIPVNMWDHIENFGYIATTTE